MSGNMHFTVYCIYQNPSDYPLQFVVRRWVGLIADEIPIIVTENLGEVRAVIPVNMYRLDRFNSDDPAILETWI